MKAVKLLRNILASAILATVSCTVSAQSWQEQIFLEYYVDTPGDTVFVDELPAAWVFPRINRRSKDPNIRKYYKLVYNFNKVYPYTAVARKLVTEADSTIAADKMGKLKKDRYVTKIQEQILEDFTDIAKHMSMSQGQLLCRLVDREIGKSSFDIVKDYKNGMAAGFWQGVAKMFNQDLKSKYDPDGQDRMTEYLIEKWEQGQFDALYYSVFMEWPKHTEIPSKYR